MHLAPERRRAMGEAARESAQRYAWPDVAERVEGVYERALEVEPAKARNASASSRSTDRRACRPGASRP